jgi:hypothetical protein
MINWITGLLDTIIGIRIMTIDEEKPVIAGILK